MNLQDIATKLESLEETIIFRLIDRAQYHYNAATYEKGLFNFGSEVAGPSLLDHKLRFSEETDAVLGRYTVSEERPFFENLPPVASNMKSNNTEELFIADFEIINLTSKIKTSYLELLPEITQRGDDKQYGTTAECDIATLQAISRRIHFGSFYVAESKYLGNPIEYQRRVAANDKAGLMELLTRKEVEERIIKRIEEKVFHIQEVSNPDIRTMVDGKVIASFYKDVVIPLTKEGEILYLQNRTHNA